MPMVHSNHKSRVFHPCKAQGPLDYRDDHPGCALRCAGKGILRIGYAEHITLANDRACAQHGFADNLQLIMR
jgi:hypothetical protein